MGFVQRVYESLAEKVQHFADMRFMMKIDSREPIRVCGFTDSFNVRDWTSDERERYYGALARVALRS